MMMHRNFEDIQPIIVAVLNKNNFLLEEREEYESAMIVILLRMLSLSTYMDVSFGLNFIKRDLLEPMINEAESKLCERSLRAIATPKASRKRAAHQTPRKLPKWNEAQVTENKTAETSFQTPTCDANCAKETMSGIKALKSSSKKVAEQTPGKLLKHDDTLVDGNEASKTSICTLSQAKSFVKEIAPEIKTLKCSSKKTVQQTFEKYLNLDEQVLRSGNEVSKVSLQLVGHDEKIAKEASLATKTQEAPKKNVGLKKLTINLHKLLHGRCEKLDKVCRAVAMRIETEKKIKAICDDESIDLSIIDDCYAFWVKKNGS